MSDQPKKDRPLSEISHLFLSSVRDRQTGGAPRPQRKPPAPPAQAPIDLTPDEFAHVFADCDSTPSQGAPSRAAPVTAVIGTHLNGRLFDRAKEYAGHLCASGSRIGLIEVDAAEFRVMLFERESGGTSTAQLIEAPEPFDLRRMSEAIEELSCDVDRWLLLLPNPRSADARPILRMVNHWVLLSTCDHDGIVAGYRTLKGLVESDRPRLSLALLGASDQDHAGKVFHKLSSVCQQFLNWPLEPEPAVHRPNNVVEHFVLCCRASRTSEMNSGVQWQVVQKLLTGTRTEKITAMEPTPDNAAAETRFVADVIVPTDKPEKIGSDPICSAEDKKQPVPSLCASYARGDEVIDLPGADAGGSAIISAVVHHHAGRLVECPVSPPMSQESRLAVSADHRLVLLAVAQAGLRDLRSVGRAYQWLMENRALVAMALPQFAIDAHQLPQLVLIVDQADLSADILQPMLQSSSVSVQAYRKLRWAGRTGLLLEAA